MVNVCKKKMKLFRLPLLNLSSLRYVFGVPGPWQFTTLSLPPWLKSADTHWQSGARLHVMQTTCGSRDDGVPTLKL